MGIFSFVKPGKKVFQTIKSVAPNVAKTKKEKLLSKLKKTTQTVKGATAKLKQTQFERANPQFKGNDFTFATKTGKSESNRERYKRIQGENTKAIKSMIDDAFDNVRKEKKAKGGRIGLKGGSNLGMQSVKYGLDNNPKITAADPKAKFIAANKKKKKKFQSPMVKAVKKKNKKKII